MLSLFPSKPILTGNQIERLSSIFDNAGQVIFGITVVSPLIVGFDKTNWSVILFGTGVVVLCWGVSVTLAKRKEMSNEF